MKKVLNLDCCVLKRVSPFSGGSHISPIDSNAGDRIPYVSRWGGEVINLNRSNFKRLHDAMKPPDNLEDLFEQGYDHADTFFRSNKFKILFLQNSTKEVDHRS